VWDAMQTVGAPVWDEAAKAVAREIQAGLGMEPMAEPFIDEMSQLIDPEAAEAILRHDLPPSQRNSTSDDYTDMTWHAPTARFYVARPALKPPSGKAYPAWVMNALGGIPATIDPMVQTAARILALSALRLLEDKPSRDAAMAEFVQRTGGGVGGKTWTAPLCDYPPPIHFRWPEYITTRRGQDWWIPSTMPGA
jgi:aminobenzoyl-glutamate utilization protein B